MSENKELAPAKDNKVKVKKEKEYDIGCVPKTFYFSFLGSTIIVPIVSFFLNIKVKPDKEFMEHEGPIIVLANHESYLDPMVINKLTGARKANFVCGEFVFRKNPWGRWFKLGGAIPKKQFVVDTVSVKSMMKVMKRGGVLIIFPEATRSVDGSTIEFDDGVAKMAKKVNASIYIAHFHGAYLSWPRWSESGRRPGKITAEFVRKIYSDEVAASTTEELQQKILDGIKYNENDWIRQNPRNFRSSKPAAGLQNIAYACPKCGKEFTMRYLDSGKHDLIQCNNCGNAARILPTGLLEGADVGCEVFDDLHKWVLWERQLIRKQIEDGTFSMTLDANLFKKWDELSFCNTGRGKVYIADGKIRYVGTDCPSEDGIPYKKGKVRAGYKNRTLDGVSRPREVEFDMKTMRGLVVSYGKYFEIYSKEGELFRFYVDGQQVFKIHEAVEYYCKK